MLKKLSLNIYQFFSNILNKQTTTDKNRDKLCFIGIGGGGANILEDISILDNQNTFIYLDNNANELKQKQSPYKILVSKNTKDLIDNKIKQQLETFTDHKTTIYIIATLGGDCGSNITPQIIKYLRTLNKKVIVSTTIPFNFEGKECLTIAMQSQDEIKLYTEELITINNNDILQHVDKGGTGKAFKIISKNIYQEILKTVSVNKNIEKNAIN